MSTLNSNSKNDFSRQDSQIFMYKSKILESIKMNQVVIIVGETGCGKSTQIPQYLHQAGLSKNGMIACLHPRCIAAITLAQRVAYETRTQLGSLVGYSVRFYSEYGEYTAILYMTTGYMLRILQEEGEINKFSVVIIDEAHERSLHNDVMMGRMKMIMEKNRDVKLVIMSATLNMKEIMEYFPGSVSVKINDSNSIVNVIYRPLTQKACILEIKDIVKNILQTSDRGHVLVFLPSEEKVRKCKKILKQLKEPIVLSFYSAMDYDDKMMVFKEFGTKRKVIVATNIAETSLTIDGVDFVIDSGYVKRVRYDHENRAEEWVTEKISMSEANQRKGRTGRTGTGTCYRLYENPEVKKKGKSKESNLRPDFPSPEIRNVNLGTIILMLKSIGIKSIEDFPFIIKPDTKNTSASIAHLKELSLLNSDETMTKLGQQVTYLPLDPTMGKVAVVSSQLACHRDVITIIALSSVLNIFKNPTGKESKTFHDKFNSKHGDLFKLLNVYEGALPKGFTKVWCKENFINHSGLKYARMVERQLNWLLPLSQKRDADLSRSKENQIKKAFLSGFFHNIVYPGDKCYTTCGDKTVTIHKGSCVDGFDNVVMGTQILKSANSKSFVLRHCVTLNIDMLNFLVPQKYKIKTTLWKVIVKKVKVEDASPPD